MSLWGTSYYEEEGVFVEIYFIIQYIFFLLLQLTVSHWETYELHIHARTHTEAQRQHLHQRDVVHCSVNQHSWDEEYLSVHFFPLHLHNTSVAFVSSSTFKKAPIKAESWWAVPHTGCTKNYSSTQKNRDMYTLKVKTQASKAFSQFNSKHVCTFFIWLLRDSPTWELKLLPQK